MLICTYWVNMANICCKSIRRNTIDSLKLKVKGENSFLFKAPRLLIQHYFLEGSQAWPFVFVVRIFFFFEIKKEVKHW